MTAGVSQILKRYGQQYLDRYGQNMTAQQKKVLRAVMACRSQALGTIRYACTACGLEHSVQGRVATGIARLANTTRHSSGSTGNLGVCCHVRTF